MPQAGSHAHSWRHISSLPTTHLRLFDDKVFTWDDWARHRNAAWRHRMEPVVFLRVASGFVWQLIIVILAAVIVGLYETLAVPEGAPGVTREMSTPFSAITFALSLLLVFKTNSSYARWWEGRILWGQIVNYGRNLPRQLLAYAPYPEVCSPAQRDLLCCALRWMAAAPHILRGHLVEATALRCEEEASHLLSPHELEYLRTRWANKPLGVTHVLSWLCSHRLLGIDHNQQVSLQDQIALFMNCAGGCERIQRTPIPAAYTRHTSRMLLIYVTLSPLMLWAACGWATPLVAPLIAFLLLGTENIGVMIEEPFRVLPLQAICRGIEVGVTDLASAAQLSLQPPVCGAHPPPKGATKQAAAENGSTGAAGGPPGSPTDVMLAMLGLGHHAELNASLHQKGLVAGNGERGTGKGLLQSSQSGAMAATTGAPIATLGSATSVDKGLPLDVSRKGTQKGGVGRELDGTDTADASQREGNGDGGPRAQATVSLADVGDWQALGSSASWQGRGGVSQGGASDGVLQGQLSRGARAQTSNDARESLPRDAQRAFSHELPAVGQKPSLRQPMQGASHSSFNLARQASDQVASAGPGLQTHLDNNGQPSPGHEDSPLLLHGK